jgi:hypothetical protein
MKKIRTYACLLILFNPRPRRNRTKEQKQITQNRRRCRSGCGEKILDREERTQNMGGDIAEWSARQIHASYDERDQISIVTAFQKPRCKNQLNPQTRAKNEPKQQKETQQVEIEIYEA